MPRLRSLPSRLSTAPGRLNTGITAGPGFSRTDGLSAAARGYDAAWRRLRLAHLLAHPHCESCRHQGRFTPATQVHHLQRFRGLHDPLRLDPRNCQSICAPCHLRESAQQASSRE
jgi:5-methylcytosine-specific restriction endonuclease McrA